ncbi:MAG: disulfide bond formation protein DsbA [Actinobacteria bacterium]|nr:MAG: disulfide bond formation protein DsbA [Actinomycetota bacterium]
MSAPVEVFADITCPFTHVGLKQVVHHVAEMDEPIDVIVRAWPLEWVNGVALDAEVVATKSCVIADQLEVDYFSGVSADEWPASTIPALNLAASAYERDAATGLAVSLELREALFEQGKNVGDADVLASIAAAHDLPAPGTDACDAVQADYDLGLARGVKGSPHFWIDKDDFFCPALDIGHDDDGHLTARFDQAKLADFFQRIDT